MSVRCPNCGSEVDDEPVRCKRCGYRSELAVEYLWLYLAGALILLSGFVFGALSVAVVNAPENHWSRRFEGWFPLGPWPFTYHWLAFLIEGIVLTLAGFGITRRSRMALIAFAGLCLWEMVWTSRELTSGGRGSSYPLLAGFLLALEMAGIAIALRLGVALHRISRNAPRGSPEAE